MKKFKKIIIASIASVSLLAGCGDNPNPDPGPNPDPVPEVIKVESVTLNQKTLTLDVNASAFLRATIAPENAANKNLKWSSSDDSIAMVASNGKVLALSVGTATITVESEEDSGKKDSCVVTVVKEDKTVHVTSVEVSPKTIALDLGGTITAKPSVTVLPENATKKDVVWSSSDPTKVVVDSLTGAITALAKTESDVTITATSLDNEGIKDTLTVSVADTRDVTVHVTSVEIEDMKVDLNKGGEGQLVAVVNPSNAYNKKVNFVSDDPDTVTVTAISDTVATVKGLKVGTATITATSEDGEKTDTCVVTVEDSTVEVTGMSIKINGSETDESTPVSIENGKNISVTAAVTPDNASNKELTWSIVSENGNQYVNLSSTEETTITILAKKLTTESVVVRATSVANSNIHKDLLINVIDPTDVDRWVDFVEPENFGKYKSRISENNLNDTANVYEQPNLSAKYFKYGAEDAEKYVYRVGDQGVFEFAPSAYVKLAHETTQTEIKNVATNKALYVYGKGEYKAVNLSDYFELTDNSKYTAKVDASGRGLGVGKKFKLVLTPDSKYYVKEADSIEFEFYMVHAYNVYNLAQLSLYDNYQSIWDSYKRASGLGDVSAKGGIVLHSDIKFLSDILPVDFVWTQAEVEEYIAHNEADFNNWAHVAYPNDDVTTERANAKAAFINSLKDNVSIFVRSTASEDFTFEGNFFSIDASSCKKIALMGSGDDTLMGGWNGDGSHTELFQLNYEDLDHPYNWDAPHSVTMRNFAMKGNGSLTDGAVSKGGLILIKPNACVLNLQNVQMSQSFTSILTTDSSNARSFTSVIADRVYAYDSYSSAFYFWGTKKNTITNSWLSKCGGPLFILDEPVRSPNTLYPSEVECTNCYLFNEVTGSEPWFEGHPGSDVLVKGNIITPGLIPASEAENETKWYGAYAAGFAAAGLPAGTIARYESEKYQYCNFIAIDVICSNFAANVEHQLQGKFIVHNGTDELNLDMADTTKAGPGVTSIVPTAVCPMIFKSSVGGVGYLAMDGTTPVPTFNDPTALCGNFTSIYMDPVLASAGSTAGKMIGAVLGTYPIK